MKIKQFITLSLALSFSTLIIACTDNTTGSATASATSTATTTSAANAVTELIKTDVKVGSGAEAKAGQTVEVHYTGWLYDPAAADKHGKKFDSSHKRSKTFKFPLGGGRVIKGWDQGVEGMKVGGQRTLIIPSAMAYGARGAGRAIPPNATLIFDVELMGVK